MLKIYELIGDIGCTEIVVTATPTRKIEHLEGWIGAHIRNMLLTATNKVECEGYGSLMDRIRDFPITDVEHPWYKELKSGFPKGYAIKVLAPKQRNYQLSIDCGESIRFSVTLIGSMDNYTQKMIEAIGLFAQRGIHGRMEHTIESVKRYSLLELLYEKHDDNMLRIDFVTPISLSNSKRTTLMPNSLQGKMNGFISMYQLVTSAANRAAKMAVLYGDCRATAAELSQAVEEIATVAKKVTLYRCGLRHIALLTDKKRTTKDAMVFDGLVGHTEWSGEIAQLYPLLKLCSHISLGENVVYGMGDFDVV